MKVTIKHSRLFTAFCYLTIYSISTASIGFGHNLVKRAELPDLNDFPLEHGLSEHPATHDQRLPGHTSVKKRRSDRPRIARTRLFSPVTPLIEATSETECEHSKGCKHWKKLPTKTKTSIRVRAWRKKLVSIIATVLNRKADSPCPILSQKKFDEKKADLLRLSIEHWNRRKKERQDTSEIIKFAKKNIMLSKVKKGKKCLPD